ncbi:hypothetical protein C2S52_007128 [Perilla frutescens var. hirtella]|nr:hypothetical protein C2S51_008729 [Perilla frutescens var. frutescens]KAH6787576.1 hypothetical protein C2S52_007128 [Perilla frutescens var. hirtella]
MESRRVSSRCVKCSNRALMVVWGKAAEEVVPALERGLGPWTPGRESWYCPWALKHNNFIAAKSATVKYVAGKNSGSVKGICKRCANRVIKCPKDALHKKWLALNCHCLANQQPKFNFSPKSMLSRMKSSWAVTTFKPSIRPKKVDARKR